MGVSGEVATGVPPGKGSVGREGCLLLCPRWAGCSEVATCRCPFAEPGHCLAIQPSAHHSLSPCPSSSFLPQIPVLVWSPIWVWAAGLGPVDQ